MIDFVVFNVILVPVRERLQWKAHSEERARTCNEKRGLKGHVQMQNAKNHRKRWSSTMKFKI